MEQHGDSVAAVPATGCRSVQGEADPEKVGMLGCLDAVVAAGVKVGRATAPQLQRIAKALAEFHCVVHQDDLPMRESAYLNDLYLRLKGRAGTFRASALRALREVLRTQPRWTFAL